MRRPTDAATSERAMSQRCICGTVRLGASVVEADGRSIAATATADADDSLSRKSFCAMPVSYPTDDGSGV